MKIAGFEKNSFVDYRGKVASVIFTPSCNFDCFYCHNSFLINEGKETIPENQVFEYLSKRKKLIDGVVVTGGEPLLQEDLANYLKKIKDMGFLLKLDTNGSFPEKLERLIDQHLIDYVAMDIKAPPNKYHQATGKKTSIQEIKESVEMLSQNKVEYEFRTTVYPTLTLEDIEQIGVWIQNSPLYVLQQFRKPLEKDRLKDMRNFIKPHDAFFFEKAKAIALAYVQKVEIRGISNIHPTL